MQTGAICGDRFDGELSDAQSANIVDTMLEVTSEIPDVDISAINIISYSAAACCSAANPEVACQSASEEDQTSSLGLAFPVECGETCPDLPDTIGGIDAHVVVGDAFVTNGIVIAGGPIFDMSGEVIEIATQCVSGSNYCTTSSTCCGVADGCSCNNISESYCSYFGCTIDPSKGCCGYDICEGV